MNNSPVHRVVLLLAAALLAAPLWSQTKAAESRQAVKPGNEGAAALTPVQRYEGKAVLKLRSGRAQELHVIMRSWDVHGQQHVEKFPETGFLLVHLHSGKVVTVIDGKQQDREGGDFWTVPSGSTMSVQVKSESALLQTLAIKK
jgi:hypothetical protein